MAKPSTVIYQFNMDGKKIASFVGYAQATRLTGLSMDSIKSAIKRKTFG